MPSENVQRKLNLTKFYRIGVVMFTKAVINCLIIDILDIFCAWCLIWKGIQW